MDIYRRKSQNEKLFFFAFTEEKALVLKNLEIIKNSIKFEFKVDGDAVIKFSSAIDLSETIADSSYNGIIPNNYHTVYTTMKSNSLKDKDVNQMVTKTHKWIFEFCLEHGFSIRKIELN